MNFLEYTRSELPKDDVIPATWDEAIVLLRSLDDPQDVQPVRVLVFPGDQKLAVICDEARDEDGEIIRRDIGEFCWYRREHDGKPARWIVVRHGLFALYRMFSHIAGGHKRELLTVREARDYARKLGLELVMLTDENIEYPWAVNAKRSTWDQLHQVGRVRNIEKQVGKALLYLACNYRDGAGQIQHAVLVARTEGAVKAFSNRMGQITDMAPWIEFHMQVIRRVINAHQDVLEQVPVICANMIEVLESPPSEVRRQQLNMLIKRFCDAADRLTLKPYVGVGNHLAREGREFIELSAKGGPQEWALMLQLAKRAQLGASIALQVATIEKTRVHCTIAAQYNDGEMEPWLRKAIVSGLLRMQDRLKDKDDVILTKPVLGDLMPQLDFAIQYIRGEEYHAALEPLCRVAACLAAHQAQ